MNRNLCLDIVVSLSIVLCSYHLTLARNRISASLTGHYRYEREAHCHKFRNRETEKKEKMSMVKPNEIAQALTDKATETLSPERTPPPLRTASCFEAYRGKERVLFVAR